MTHTGLAELIMPDELANRGQKGSHIQMDDDLEVRNWCRHLRVSRDELHHAVSKVGNSASAVRKELARVATADRGVTVQEIKADQRWQDSCQQVRIVRVFGVRVVMQAMTSEVEEEIVEEVFRKRFTFVAER